MNSKNSVFGYWVLRMTSIKYNHWFGFNYVFDDCLGNLKKVVFRSNWDASQNTETRDGRVAQQCWNEASMRRWDQANGFFNHLRIDQRQTTSHSPLHSPNEKKEFLCFWFGRRKRQPFVLELESKLVPVDNFLFSESYVWFLLIPKSIKTSTPFLVCTSSLLLPVL